MKTILNIVLVILVGYLLWIKFSGNNTLDTTKETNDKDKKTETIMIKGKVTGVFTLLNQTVCEVEEKKSGKKYNLILKSGLTIKTDSTIICKARKFDIIRINDKNLTVYKEVL